MKAYVRHLSDARPIPATRAAAVTLPSAIITAPPPPRLDSPIATMTSAIWVEVILGKYRYGQPSNFAGSAGPQRPGTAGLARNAGRWLADPLPVVRAGAGGLVLQADERTALPQRRDPLGGLRGDRGQGRYALVSVGDPFAIGHLLLYRSQPQCRGARRTLRRPAGGRQGHYRLRSLQRLQKARPAGGQHPARLLLGPCAT